MSPQGHSLDDIWEGVRSNGLNTDLQNPRKRTDLRRESFEDSIELLHWTVFHRKTGRQRQWKGPEHRESDQ